VTPKGTRPGDAPRLASHGHAHEHGSTSANVAASTRYTPPVSREMIESPRWVPILMFTLLILGGIVIMLRYIVWTDSNWPVLAGLALLLGGLYTATKWR
jgi:LPXTG-motif cell wall-anchored protein